MSAPKIVLVTRRTRLEGLIERFNTREQARFYITHNGGEFEIYEREHEKYYAAVQKLRSGLQKLGKVQAVERSFLPNFLFSQDDLVVTVGVDGLVVNTAKYLDGQALVAVNPDPDHIDGILMPFTVAQAEQAVGKTLEGKSQITAVSMAEARLNDGQRLVAFNDLFIGVSSHVSARYTIRHAGKQEQHSSSGVIVSTGVGSTGWLSSLFNMAAGMWTHFSNVNAQASVSLERPQMTWQDDRLVFVVREPFTSKTSSATLVCGMVDAQHELEIESLMPAGGVIFSDGVEADFLSFNAGATARIGLAARKAHLITGY
jgi:NAD kinase